MSIRFTPSSTARRSVASAPALSSGGPHTPLPQMRMAPYPSRFTCRSPPIANVPAAAALLESVLLIRNSFAPRLPLEALARASDGSLPQTVSGNSFAIPAYPMSSGGREHAETCVFRASKVAGGSRSPGPLMDPTLPTNAECAAPALHASEGTPSHREPDANPQPNLHEPSLPPRLWPALLLTGAASGLAGGLLMKLLRLVQHACYHYSSGDFLDGVRGVSGTRRIVVMSAAGLLTGIVLLFVRRLRDSHGPGLTESIWNSEGSLPVRSMSVRSVLSIVIVGMGASLGREAALKQSGGILGDAIASLFRTTSPHRKLLVACGVGAGMAAAYNVPFGGALFTLEVLLGTGSLASAIPAFAASFLATWVAWLFLPNEPSYIFPYLPATRSVLAFAILCGPLMGLIAVGFVRGIDWSRSHAPRGWAVLAMPIMLFTLVGCAAVYWPALLGNGKNVVQLAFDWQISTSLLFVLFFLRPLATMVCLRAGAPGGLFTPTMTCGALSGAVLGQLWSYIVPGADKRSCAAIGSGAILAAATQAPISSAAFILELTYNANTLMLPLLAAIAGACLTYRRFESRTSY